MVGDDDPVDPAGDGLLRVLGRQRSLHEQRPLPRLSQSPEVVEALCWVAELLVHVFPEHDSAGAAILTGDVPKGDRRSSQESQSQRGWRPPRARF